MDTSLATSRGEVGGAASGKGGDGFSLRPGHRQDAVPAPSSLPRRLASAAVGLGGLLGAAALAVLAVLRPDLGESGPALLAAAAAAAGLPGALTLRRAVAGGRRGPAGPADSAREAGAARGRGESPDGKGQRAPADTGRHEQPSSSDDSGNLVSLRPSRRHRAQAAEVSGGASGLVPPAMRRHARIKPRNTRTFIATEDGRRLNATIVDVSLSGVAIEANLPGLWIGSMVTVGSRRAKAVRVLPRGMAFEFSIPVPVDALTVDFVM